MIIFLIFLFIPLIEITTLVTVGGYIGFFWTFSLCILTALIGSALLRYQGLQTLTSIRTSFSQNHLPTDELFDGFCLVAAGTLLLTPGFLTDIIGFLLFTPPFRRFLQNFLKKQVKMQTHIHMGFEHTGLSDPNVIDGECQHVEENDNNNNNNDKPL